MRTILTPALCFVLILASTPGCGSRPVVSRQLLDAGVPLRHAQTSSWPRPFTKDLYRWLRGTRGAALRVPAGEPAVVLAGYERNRKLTLEELMLEESKQRREKIEKQDKQEKQEAKKPTSYSSSSTSWNFSGSGSEGLLLLAIVAAGVVIVVAVVAAAGWGAYEVRAEAAYVGYSVPASGAMLACRGFRTVVFDAPSALFHRCRSTRGKIAHDITQMVKLWNGVPKRGNAVLAINGSGDAILAYAHRLERVTGFRYGPDPARWIRCYERNFGPWRGQHPRSASSDRFAD